MSVKAEWRAEWALSRQFVCLSQNSFRGELVYPQSTAFILDPLKCYMFFNPTTFHFLPYWIQR